MYKEVVICIVVIVTIVLLDAVTQKYTRNTTSDITQIFSDLKGNMLEEDKNEIDKKVKILDEKWGQKHDRLAYYIEHDELEKVDTAIVSLKSYVETDDYSSAIAELDKGKFILEHIQKKYAFNLENMF
jgi:uncharacterized membrane protein YgaE (UPF0421/DUF939 family)